jgi:cell division protease FtsH
MAGGVGGHDEREQTLNQLLVEMDGFDSSSGVILIAATNRRDVLDPALLRPGRFDRHVHVSLPDLKGRESILSVHIRKNRVPLVEGTNLTNIARSTMGFSGAELENLVNEAALMAARGDKLAVGEDDFDAAWHKIIMGPERKSRVMNDDDKRRTAYHEAGHALVRYYSPKSSSALHKVTIVPRGWSLGLTVQLPKEESFARTLAQVKADLAVGAGGHVAERIILGNENISTGASNDIQQNTDLARHAVLEGGLVAEGEARLRNYTGNNPFFSQSEGEYVDREVNKLLKGGYTEAFSLITEKRDALERLARALLKYETLDAGEVANALEGRPVRPETPGANVVPFKPPVAG